jgi:anti-sigma factor RsiW
MNCQELVRSLSDYIDGALTPESKRAVEDHIADCLDCHVVLDSMECTILLYRASRTTALSEERRRLLLRKLETACQDCGGPKAPERGP